MKFILIAFVLLFAISTFSRPNLLRNKAKRNAFDSLIIYETAKDTDLRLSKLDEYVFINKNQAQDGRNPSFES